MELNWTTFVLEIVNFLILVWLLKHFLYQPVKTAVERRRKSIEEQLAAAQQRQGDADALRLQYENRLHDWEGEREEARRQLQHEIEDERQHLQNELQQNLEQQRQKAEVLNARQLEEHRRESESLALQQGARFAGRLLSRVASADLEARLFELLLEELRQLPAEQREALQGLGRDSQRVEVVSAYDLSEHQQQKIRDAFAALVPLPLHYRFIRDDSLVAGLRITASSWVLHANLHDELKSFAAITHDY